MPSSRLSYYLKVHQTITYINFQSIYGKGPKNEQRLSIRMHEIGTILWQGSQKISLNFEVMDDTIKSHRLQLHTGKG